IFNIVSVSNMRKPIAVSAADTKRHRHREDLKRLSNSTLRSENIRFHDQQDNFNSTYTWSSRYGR
ncbi:hypothetical protein KIN20_030526, partial [Parelaphostrongylus tenuis]